MTSEARVSTATPERYVTRLCKHFAHKVPATWDGPEGRVEFPMGTCALHAGDGALVLRATADTPEALSRVEDVIGRHLLGFAEGKEDLDVAWAPAEA